MQAFRIFACGSPVSSVTLDSLKIRRVTTSLTIGIDLAAQSAGTAACAIRWDVDGRGVVEYLTDGVTNGELVEIMRDPLVARTAIDSPFGWPVEFVEEITRFTRSGAVPATDNLDDHRRSLRLRATDRELQERLGLTPLSVSTDRIGVVALRCARLLTDYYGTCDETLDRSGNGKVLETYPAAVLRLWRLSPAHGQQDAGTYKGSSPGALRRRRRIMRTVARYGDGWLAIPREVAIECEQSDHKLDALICALVARAADKDQLFEISNPERAAIEGWIRVPLDEPLSFLSGRLATSSHWLESDEPLIPDDGYLEVPMPDQFELEIQDRLGGPWNTWALMRADWFGRADDGSYVCTVHGGSPVYIRALSVDRDSGIIEHVDGDGFGSVYRYRLRPNLDSALLRS
jgi:hypothetical protein